MEKKFEELNENIKELNVIMKRTNSLYYLLLKGALFGFGSAIGATVIAVIVITILSNFIQSINDVPILNKIINSI